ncbi:chaperone modulator CbpM [Polaromonas sp. LjRoot131]|jgi:chaperone modulatory protein CbpM|uniref:chaperone modulator CbpM n=1 Tax=Polaromonas sp. LjRoot131 TaxID=3342262 RepID=UPI003ECE8B1A
MNLQVHESLWLNGRNTVDMPELSRICGLSTGELLELVDYGALAPVNAQAQLPLFSDSCIAPLRQAMSIRSDFDLDIFTVAVLLGYINRIADLERQLRALRAQAPSHSHSHGQREGPASWHEAHAGDETP